MTIESPSVSKRPQAARRAGSHAQTTAGRAASCCAPGEWRAWSAPPLPADTPVKRRIDHIVPRPGWPAAAYFAAVIGLLGLAQVLPPPGYLVVDAVAFLAGGSWCALNFLRRRQAHCVVTGAGWLAMALFVAAEAGLGHSLIHGDEQLLFLLILAVGLVFEGGRFLAR